MSADRRLAIGLTFRAMVDATFWSPAAEAWAHRPCPRNDRFPRIGPVSRETRQGTSATYSGVLGSSPSVVSRTRWPERGAASAVAHLADTSVAAVLACPAADAARDGLVTLSANAIDAAASAVRRIAGGAVRLAETAGIEHKRPTCLPRLADKAASSVAAAELSAGAGKAHRRHCIAERHRPEAAAPAVRGPAQRQVDSAPHAAAALTCVAHLARTSRPAAGGNARRLNALPYVGAAAVQARRGAAQPVREERAVIVVGSDIQRCVVRAIRPRGRRWRCCIGIGSAAIRERGHGRVAIAGRIAEVRATLNRRTVLFQREIGTAATGADGQQPGSQDETPHTRSMT